jgi:hypothetical protein
VGLANEWGWIVDTDSCVGGIYDYEFNDDYFVFILYHGNKMDIIRKVLFKDGQVFTDMDYSNRIDLCDPRCFDKLKGILNDGN